MPFYERGLMPLAVVFGGLDLSPYLVGMEFEDPQFAFLLTGFDQRFREDLYLLYERSGTYFQPLYFMNRGFLVAFNSYTQDIKAPSSLTSYAITRLEGQIMNKQKQSVMSYGDFFAGIRRR